MTAFNTEQAFKTLLEQNAQIYNQNTEIRSQNTEIRSEMHHLRSEINTVQAKLDRIESHVVIIKNAVISDFTNISQSTKNLLETTGNTAADDEEFQLQLAIAKEEIPAPVVIKEGKAKVKKRPTVSFRDAVSELGTNIEFDAPASSVGNWVSSVVTKAYGHNFKGRYPAPLLGFLSTLILYYSTERVSFGRKH